MDFSDDLVVDDPLTFCDFLKEEISMNVFGFGGHLDFGFTKFGGLSHVRAVFYHDWLVLVSPDLDGWVA